jgi:DNA-binding response OmpR family regulator
MRILLVEDQADLLRHIERALRQGNHDVEVSKEGPSAVDAAIAAFLI